MLLQSNQVSMKSDNVGFYEFPLKKQAIPRVLNLNIWSVLDDFGSRDSSVVTGQAPQQMVDRSESNPSDKFVMEKNQRKMAQTEDSWHHLNIVGQGELISTLLWMILFENIIRS